MFHHHMKSASKHCVLLIQIQMWQRMGSNSVPWIIWNRLLISCSGVARKPEDWCEYLWVRLRYDLYVNAQWKLSGDWEKVPSQYLPEFSRTPKFDGVAKNNYCFWTMRVTVIIQELLFAVGDLEVVRDIRIVSQYFWRWHMEMCCCSDGVEQFLVSSGNGSQRHSQGRIRSGVLFLLLWSPAEFI